VFERFSKSARQVVVLAQEEARELRHNYIGTEHVLLGLLGERDGIAARALGSLGVQFADVRSEVAKIIGQGEEVTSVEIPFTPRAKRTLELSLGEALALGHNYVGTEHLLLGLARENQGVAARILYECGFTAADVAGAVLRELGRDPALARRSFSAAEPTADREPRSRRAAQGRHGHLFPRARFVFGWLLLAIALAIGILVGWLIWGNP